MPRIYDPLRTKKRGILRKDFLIESIELSNARCLLRLAEERPVFRRVA
jgi:hypothetical protein